MDFLVTTWELGCICVLDISSSALARARARLGQHAQRVQWIEADVTGDWPSPSVDIWHDRAVFHFLTDPHDRLRYRQKLEQAVRPRGSAIIAAFGPDGPEECSGLPVVRYSPDALGAELGVSFSLQEAIREDHLTPFGTVQQFWYSRLTRRALR